MIVLLVKFTLLLHLIYSLPFIWRIKIIIYYQPTNHKNEVQYFRTKNIFV